MPWRSLRSFLIKSMNLDNRHVDRKSTQTFLEDLSFLEEVQSSLCFQWKTTRKYTFFSQAKLKYKKAIPNSYQKALPFLLSKASMLIFSRLWIGYWMMSEGIFIFYSTNLWFYVLWCGVFSSLQKPALYLAHGFERPLAYRCKIWSLRHQHWPTMWLLLPDIHKFHQEVLSGPFMCT